MKFVANGVKYELETNQLTFAEGKAIEKAAGRTMAEIERTKADDLGTVQALVWVAMKRVDPTLKYADLEDMPISDVEWIAEDDNSEQEPDVDSDPMGPTNVDGEPQEDSTPTG